MAVLVATPAPAAGKKLWGGVLIASGAGLMVGAFDYRTSCPSGYTTHTYQVPSSAWSSTTETWCVDIDTLGNSDVRKAPTSGTFKRPALLWSGLATIGVGTVLLALPTRVQQVTKGVDVAITPGGWQTSKSFRF